MGPVSVSRLDVETVGELEQILLPQLGRRFGANFDRPLLREVLAELDELYAGRTPGYLKSDTPYHDLKHTLDTTLVAARIADGLIAAGQPLTATEMLLIILGALHHDVGYIRHSHEADIQGAALTRVHVSRSEIFFRNRLSRSSLAKHADGGSAMLHYTGYEQTASALDARLPETYRRLGKIIATADLVSQMADRYYLERCRDDLFYEFSLAGGMAPGSPEELLEKTPGFMAHVLQDRLERDLEGYYRYLGKHFGCVPDPYMAAVRSNAGFIAKLAENKDFLRLRRNTALRTGSRLAELTMHQWGFNK